MKTTPILFALSMFALTACNPTTQEAMKTGVRSGVALEAYATKSSFGLKRHQDRVAATPATVRTRLAAFAKNCVNNQSVEHIKRSTSVGSTTMTAGGGMMTTGAGIPTILRMEFAYKSYISNEDGTARFIVSQANKGDVLHVSEGSKGYNVQLASKILSDGAGGTILSTTRNLTYGYLFKDALGWARGETTTCPKL